MMLENTWTWADIVQLAAGFILFVVGIWIGKKQEKSVNLTEGLTKEIKSLQSGLSELEMYEKIGVIERGLQRVEGKEANVAPALLYDCLAVLPMLEFSGQLLANKYSKLLLRSLELLTDYYSSVDSSAGKKPMPAILIAASLKAIDKLKGRGKQEIAEELTGTLARYLEWLKYNKQQKAEETCSYLLQPETVKLFLNLESGDIPRIIKLLAPCHRRQEN